MKALQPAGKWQEEWRTRPLYTGPAELFVAGGVGRVVCSLEGHPVERWGPADVLQAIFGEDNHDGEFDFIIDDDGRDGPEVAAIIMKGRPRERCVLFRTEEMAA